MATNDSPEFDYVPGYTKPTHVYGEEFGDEFHAPRVVELLKAANPGSYFQKGVTLAGGQGILPTGCVLARKTSDKKYYLYASGQSDGRQTALGILRNARDTGGTTSPAGKPSTDCLGNIVSRGILDLTLLSGTDTTSQVTAAAGGFGSGTTGAGTQLGGRYDFVTNTFYF